MMDIVTVSTERTHRAATWHDIPAIVELCNQVMMAMWGVAEWSIADTETLFSRPGFNLEHYVRVWQTPSGQLVGVGILSEVREPPVRVRVMPYILPTLPYHRELGMEILTWGESVALRVAVPQCPAHVKVQFLSWTNRNYTPYTTLYQAYNMQIIRQYWTMTMDLHGEVAAPTLPPEVVIRTLRDPDERRLMYQLLDASFADHYGYVNDPSMKNFDAWAHHRFTAQGFDPTLWFIAEINGTIAGFVWCRAGATEDDQLGFIETLGVLPAFRRQGMATLLLHHAFRTLYERGMKTVELEVDATNITGATRLYERVGMHRLVVWDTYAKVLRDGIEMVRE